MKKTYTSPSFETLSLLTAEEILTASEEGFDINVSFDTLWGTGIWFGRTESNTNEINPLAGFMKYTPCMKFAVGEWNACGHEWIYFISCRTKWDISWYAIAYYFTFCESKTFHLTQKAVLLRRNCFLWFGRTESNSNNIRLPFTKATVGGFISHHIIGMIYTSI